MRFREKHQEDAGIDLTPFIDVVFMLLLFFVVSTTLFKGATELKVQLPQAKTQSFIKSEKTIEIGIDAQGAYYLNGVSINSSDPKKLKKILTVKLEKNPSLALVLAGDKKSPHQAVIWALEIASQLGISQVQIIAQK
ncbi:MAG: biopolymer transporter ExbD [Proteobacteria bacterium]|nr:biopolymer transporter ExbD [Pseudomonadota bacterium]